MEILHIFLRVLSIVRKAYVIAFPLIDVEGFAII